MSTSRRRANAYLKARGGKRDSNELVIKTCIEGYGWDVYRTSAMESGFPDLVVLPVCELCGCYLPMFVAEVKGRSGALNNSQKQFWQKVPFPVFRTIEDVQRWVDDREWSCRAARLALECITGE